MQKDMSKTEPFSAGLFAFPPESEAVTLEQGEEGRHGEVRPCRTLRHLPRSVYYKPWPPSMRGRSIAARSSCWRYPWLSPVSAHETHLVS
jgi:hypothetical protein